MGDIDYLRERESAADDKPGARAGRHAMSETGAPAERKWPLGISILIAVVISLLLWAGIIAIAIRVWRWI
jgi:hypothetical protein